MSGGPNLIRRKNLIEKKSNNRNIILDTVTVVRYVLGMVEEVRPIRQPANSLVAFCFSTTGGTLSKTKPNWTEIARAYAGGEGTIADICEEFSVTRSSLYRRAKKLNWTKRQVDSQTKQAVFVERMYCVLNKQLEQIDKRISADGPIDVVALSNIAKTFEKLIELGSPDKAAKVQKSDGKALRMLRELLAQNMKTVQNTNGINGQN